MHIYAFKLKYQKSQKCCCPLSFLKISLTKHKSTETDLVSRFLLIIFQRVQVHDAGRLKELIIDISVTRTVPTVSTHTAHFICRWTQDGDTLHKICIS